MEMDMGYQALTLILRDIAEKQYHGLISDSVAATFPEVLGIGEAWALAAVLQDAIGAFERETNPDGVIQRTSPFAEAPKRHTRTA